jgi:Ca-activated chloride channel family protein
MFRKFFLNSFVVLTAVAMIIVALAAHRSSLETVSAQTGETQGSLVVLDPDGKPKAQCPLKHTDVKAEISGFLSRVILTQEFENPFKEKIEAVYTFPLPQNAAVDDMTMIVGDRTVRGKILRREEAQAVYEAAKAGGQVASLLDQERPNIFTQSVANILPGDQIRITISYVEKLKYSGGAYEFMFPMVVAPRYVPGTSPANQQEGNGFAPGTNQVPDASRITPRPVPEGMRAGHDVSLDITLDAGVAIDGLESKTHPIAIERTDERRAHVRLKNSATIPNKDFVLRYDVAGSAIQDALLTHRSTMQGGFFTMILQPPERVTAEDVMPKELVFVVDTSGSMSGFPIEKAKETMKLALDNLYPTDTFNLITFAGDTHILFPQPVAANVENLKKAQAFLDSRSGSGGTEMMKAIKAALDPSDAQGHVRIVCFLTDGEVGNDMEIISEVQKHPNARVFAFGIGSSVNRFLLDKVAEYGRGEVEYVALNDDGSAAARRFHERVRSPLLTDISIEWNGLPVADVYPQRIPDLFSAKPVILSGRYTAGAHGIVRLKAKMAGNDFVREIPVDFPEVESQHDVLASLWARDRIDDLMGQDYAGLQHANMRPELKETITQIGLEYRLMTQFTSFVAVEEMVVTDGGQPRRIDVPVEVPEGMNRAAVFGAEVDAAQIINLGGNGRNYSSFALLNTQSRSGTNSAKAKLRTTVGAGSAGGTGPGAGGNVGGGGRSDAADGGKPSSPPPSNASMTVTVTAGVAELSEAYSTPKSSPEEARRDQLRTKVHPSILAVIERLKKKDSNPAAAEAAFIRGGKAELQIWLTDKSDEALAKLKELGFEVVLDPKTSKLIIGRLPLEKLEALADLKWVRYVGPQTATR